MCVPGHGAVIFRFEDEDDIDRVNVDNSAAVMCFTFKIVTPNNPKIRLMTRAYTKPENANSDWTHWTKALGLVKEGAEIALAFAEAAVMIAPMMAGR